MATAILAAGGAVADPVTIVAMGDSLTQGYGLRVQDGFVPQLQGWLDARGAQVRVVNAGVSGDTTAGGLSRVAWTLTPDVDGMIVALGANDLLRGIDPAVSRTNLHGILSAAKQQDVPVVLVGMQAAANYGAAYKTQFEAMYPDLAAEFDVPLIPNFFGGLGSDLSQARSVFQADGIHPNSEGVALIVGEVGPTILDLVAHVGGCAQGCEVAE